MFYHYSIVCSRCLIGMELLRWGLISTSKFPRLSEVKKGQTCVDTLRSTDQVHPNHELVLVVRKKPVHQTLTGRCDIERPIFLLLGRAPQQAFCRIRKVFVDKHPHLHMSNTCHPSPSHDCQQLCSLFGLGHIYDRNPDERIHNIMHALYKHWKYKLPTRYPWPLLFLPKV